MKETSSGAVKVYFKNLNSIRFIAAFLVVIHHTEQLKGNFKIANQLSSPFVQIIGKLGVILFFVLSGFLISYLLFVEKEVKKTISIKKFYIRRILRIWPLYFLVVLSSFFLLPHSDLLAIPGISKTIVSDNLIIKLLLFVAFLPNLALVLFGAIPYVSQAWSIGAEEQFYLIWPVLNKKITNKWLLIFGVIGCYLFLRIVFYFLPQSHFTSIASQFIASMPIDCMAIGGFFALLLFEKSTITDRIKTFIFSKSVQILVLVITIFLISIGFSIPFFRNEFYAVLFGIIISNFAFNENRLFSIEHKILNYLGKISYGLYMFHPLLIVMTIKISQAIKFENDYFIYPVVLLLSFAISSLSYELFEKRFINMKINYSDIISGDNAKE